MLDFQKVGGPSGILLIECFDWEDDGKHRLIGKCSAEVKKRGYKLKEIKLQIIENVTKTLLNNRSYKHIIII